MPSEFSKFAWSRATEAVKLTALERDLATLMFNRADPDGSAVYVTEAKLAEKYGKSDRQIRRSLAKLRDLGFIRQHKRGVKGRSSSEYHLTMPGLNRTFDDTSTGHDQPDTGDVNRTSQPDINDSQPDMEPFGDQGKRVSTGHGLSGIPDPSKGSGYRDLPDMDMSGVDAPRPVGEGHPASEPSRDVSSTTAIGTPWGVPLPDTDSVSGLGHPQPATESEAMIDNPWTPATASDDESDYYGALADEHYATDEPLRLPVAPAVETYPQMYPPTGHGCRANPWCEKPQPCDCGTPPRAPQPVGWN